jgi:hypothetical protein
VADNVGNSTSGSGAQPDTIKQTTASIPMILFIANS